MKTYKHTQIAWIPLIMIIISFIYSIVSGDIYRLVRSFHPVWIVLVLLGIILFLTLTVKVDDQQIKIAYGVRLFKKNFLIKNVESVCAVRNRWWYGSSAKFMGAKKIPEGWLIGIWGLDAVEIVMRNGRVYRIGTNEPQKLLEQIQGRLHK